MYRTEGSTTANNLFLISIVAGSYLLHTMRNISEIYSIVPLILAGIGFLLCLLKRNKIDILGFSVLTFFILVYFLPLSYSFFWYPNEAYTVAFARYLYIVPFIFFSMVAISSVTSFVHLLKVYSWLIVAGGISIFYQIIFGPISWFPEASEREGLVRFSSLAGNLTAYGIFGGLALPIIYQLFEKKLTRISCLVLVIVAMLCTLQKAAVINIALFVIFLFFSGPLANKLKIVGFVVFVAPVLVLIFYLLDVSYVVATVDNILRFREGSGVSDVSITQSVYDRLWYLPSRLYEMHGPSGLIFGVGMVGGSGTLGFPDYPMAHNGIFDLLFIGGIMNLLTFTFLVSFVGFRIWVLKKRCARDSFLQDVLKVSLFVYILLLVNILFSGPLNVQPYGGVIFYAISTFVCLRKANIKSYATSDMHILESVRTH